MFVFGSFVVLFDCSFIWFRDCVQRYHWCSSVLLLFSFIVILFCGSGRVVYFILYMSSDFCMFFRVHILTVSLADLMYCSMYRKDIVSSISSMVIDTISSIRVKAFISLSLSLSLSLVLVVVLGGFWRFCLFWYFCCF